MTLIRCTLDLSFNQTHTNPIIDVQTHGYRAVKLNSS